MNRTEFLSSRMSSNMLIDAHTHNGSDLSNIVKFRYPTSQSVIDLVDKTHRSGIDLLITFPCPSDLFWFEPLFFRQNNKLVPQKNPPEPFPHYFNNETMYREIANFSGDHVLPFANFIPGIKDDQQVEYLHAKNSEGTLFGLKFHPLASQTPAEILESSPISNFAQQYRLPITIHTGPDKYSQPMKVFHLAQKFPTINFCAAHVGQFNQEFLDSIAKSRPENLFIDTSPFISLSHAYGQNHQDSVIDLPFSDPKQALLSLYDFLPNNLIWGTDEPWTTITNDKTGGIYSRVVYQQEADLLNSLPLSVRQKIAHNNTLRFLGR